MKKIAAVLVLLAGCSSPPPKTEAPKARPVKITHFYASEGAIPRGETVTICYGVEEARAVRLEPPLEPITPSFNRCIQAAPQATTEYKLTSEGTDGSTASANFTIVVGKPAPKKAAAPSAAPQRQLIKFFGTASNRVPRGQPVTLCYELAPGATSVSLSPGNRSLPLAPKHCFTEKPQASTTYILTAKDNSGAVDRVQVSVAVPE